jgi:protein-S-isoprenylcysteine O-methyltransferase Ste14
MAQTKRKRHTKHRGNAGGVVEARGRTGRPPSAEEKKRVTRDSRREERLNRKPTVKGAAQKALLGAAFMFIFALVFIHSKNESGGSRVITAVIEAVIAGLLYFAGMYYFESAMWRRRMKKKAAAARR